MKKGYIHIYCGDGKGKTTSSIGLGIRAAGAKLKVCMIQFLKSTDSNEINIIKELGERFEVFNYERSFGFFWTLNDEQKKELKNDIEKEFEMAKEIILNGKYDLIILDEVLGAIENKLIDEDELIKLLQKKAENIEVVITGRQASEKLIKIADYVSKVDAIKHPYEKGVNARKGIEF